MRQAQTLNEAQLRRVLHYCCSRRHPVRDTTIMMISVRRQSFPECLGRFLTEALVRFLFKFRQQRLGAASGVV